MVKHSRALSDFFVCLFRGKSKYNGPSHSVVWQGAHPLVPPAAANFYWIPVELVELILDRCDVRTLHSSSLVCKYWRASIVHRLFSKVELFPATSPAFVDFLQSDYGQPLRRFVRSLSLTIGSDCGHKSSAKTVKRLSALLQPSSLKLTIYEDTESERVNGFWSRPPPRKGLTVFQRGFKTVTTLELTLFSNTFIEVAQVISSFPILETLIITGGTETRQVEWEFPGDHTSLPRTVHTIRLPTVDNSSGFLHWLHSHEQHDVQKLTLGGVSTAQLTNSYLRKLGETLQCLMITGLIFRQDYYPMETIDVSHNTNLRELAILSGGRSSAEVHRILSRVTSRSMKVLEFDVWDPTDDPVGRGGRYWPRLDSLLTSPRFSGLRRVIINTNLETRNMIKAHLPIANSYKILRFRRLRKI